MWKKLLKGIGKVIVQIGPGLVQAILDALAAKQGQKPQPPSA